MSSKNSRSVERGKKKRGVRTPHSGSVATWGIVGTVLLVVVGLIVFALVRPESTNSDEGNAFQAAPAEIVSKVTNIPESMYNLIGVNSPVADVTPPKEISGQIPLEFKDSNGVSKPGFFYYGAEYCPYCAAERWAVVAALSRFGKISDLGLTYSSSRDIHPKTPSFTFVHAQFSIDVLNVRTVEVQSNIPAPGGGYTHLQNPSPEEQAILDSYDLDKYFPGMGNGFFPFIDIGNRFFVGGANFSPAILTGLSAENIASGLSNPNNPATRAIIASANYLSAAICATTSQRPVGVCTSKGVQDAKRAMGIQ